MSLSKIRLRVGLEANELAVVMAAAHGDPIRIPQCSGKRLPVGAGIS